MRPALIFRRSQRIDGGDRSRRPGTMRFRSFYNQHAVRLIERCVEGKSEIMIRSVRLLAAAALAAAFTSAASAQTTGPLDPAPPVQAAKSKQTALKKRAKHPVPAGRQITVHARPSYLTAGTQVPVGSTGNGYVYDTFNQATPIQGTFMGMRGQERLTDRFGNAGPGLTLFRF
jgi:hypothetical protein